MRKAGYTSQHVREKSKISLVFNYKSKHYAMKTYFKTDILLTSAQDGGQWSVSQPLYPRE
jgi:hypothetical protein